jgi:hypothetical protein
LFILTEEWHSDPKQEHEDRAKEMYNVVTYQQYNEDTDSRMLTLESTDLSLAVGRVDKHSENH